MSQNTSLVCILLSVLMNPTYNDVIYLTMGFQRIYCKQERYIVAKIYISSENIIYIVVNREYI